MPSRCIRIRATVPPIGLVDFPTGCGGGVPQTGTVVEEYLHLNDQEGPATKPSPKSKRRPNETAPFETNPPRTQ